ncbi:MAG: hypothetical protein RLZZ214_3660 [Verrucomicrobiota bacterium]|jgi:hypothetical protein
MKSNLLIELYRRASIKAALGAHQNQILRENRIKAFLTGACLFAAIAVEAPSAELPMLHDKQWMGYYAVHASKSYHFKIPAADGKVVLAPISANDERISGSLDVVIGFGIIETLPDGKTTLRPIRVDTLESNDPATDKLSKSTLRAKTAADASLEITIEQARGVVFVGTRVLDPGTLKNPLRGFVTAVFPVTMPGAEAVKQQENLDERDAKRAAKKAAKEAEEKLKENVVDLKWTDGKRKRLTFAEVVDAGSQEFNGPGIAAAEIISAPYKGRRIFLTAAANSAMKLSNIKPASLSEGYSIQWSPDPAKDKDGKARLALEVK